MTRYTKTSLAVLAFALLLFHAAVGNAGEPRILGFKRGPIVGVVFDTAHDRFFVQQALSGVAGAGPRQDRLITTFRLSTFERLRERIINTETAQPLFLLSCGDMRVSSSGSLLVACFQNELRFYEPNTLDLIRAFYIDARMVPLGFALDELHSQVLVLFGPKRHELHDAKSGNVVLRRYDLSSGKELQSRTLDTVDVVGRAKLVYNQASGMVAIGITHNFADRRLGNVFICRSDDTQSCEKKAEVGAIGSMAFARSELLMAMDDVSSQSNCLVALDLNTGQIARKYCGAKHKIKTGVGVAGGKAVVAFTGTSRRNPFTEKVRDLQNTLTLWCSANDQVPLTLSYTADPDLIQDQVRVVGDPLSPYIACYSLQDNAVLGIYRVDNCQ